MKLQKSVSYVLLLILAGLIYLVFFVYQNIQRHKESFQWVTYTHIVIKKINAVRSSLLDVESQLRGFVITGNAVFKKDYQEKKERLYRDISSVEATTVDNKEQQRLTARLWNLARRKIDFQEDLLRQQKLSHQEAEATVASLRGKMLTDSISAVLQTMEANENILLARRMEQSRSLTQMRFTTTAILAVFSFLMLALLLLKISNEARLRRLAEEKARLSEHKYKGLIENSALVVYATDLEGNFTYLSGKCKDLTGFTADELLGENFLTLVKDGWREQVQEFYKAQREKRTFETAMELPLVTKNGELRWIEQNVVLLQEESKPVGFQCITKDITERKYAEKLLADAEQQMKAQQQEYQERLQAILDNMPMIIYLKDLDGRFMMVNQQFHQTFGTTDEEVLGQTMVNVHTSAEGADRFVRADEQVRQTGRPVEIEETLMTTDGERNMLIIKFPLFDKSNKLFAVSAVGKDITDIVRYQRQLISARKRAEKAERLQEEFLANMSHEIRTPMNGIIGMTNLLETTVLNTEQHEYLHMIKESSNILLALINDILDLSKIKSGRMSVENADFNLHQTIDSIMAPFRVKGKEKGVQVNKILEDVPQFINGDQHKLKQVLNNLLSNAVKFTSEGAVTVFASTEKRENEQLYLVCSVTDTGIGIAPENMEQVFESFVQAGSDMVRRFGGTGLGLAITKRLIELQGGRITVSSSVGEGSSFYFELPVTLGECTGPITTAEETEAREACNRGLAGKHILLVEDNLVNQKVTCLMLQKAGMHVEIANHGKEAVALLESKSFDLIITDLQMPEMDGFQTAAYIRNRLHSTTPIIAMTASALRNEKDRCLQIGMNEYLTKPFTPAVLFYHLRRYLLDNEEAAPQAMPAAPEQKGTDLYNLGYLEEMDDAEYASEVLDLFLSLTPPALTAIKEAAMREDWTEVHKKAHSLKSSLGILQMNQLLHNMAEIETLSKSRKNTDTIETLLQQAAQQYDLVRPMLEAELQLTRKKLVL